MTIAQIIQKYKSRLDYIDIELLLAHSLGKTREFVLIHPEQTITNLQETKIKKNITRRIKKEPIAYIVGHKEFYGLDFAVNKHTLVPRPETELMVENVITLLRSKLRNKITTIDIGTGSGCIITAIAHSIKNETRNMERQRDMKFFGSDIGRDALKIARKNSKIHGLDKKIKFLHGSLLTPLIKNYKSSVISNQSLIIAANLPYLSKEIYNSAPIDVKKFEPKSALYSAEKGLAHYRKLLKQIKKIQVISHQSSVILFLEISPEQKIPISKIIKTILPESKTTFQKDLAGKWRVCQITL